MASILVKEIFGNQPTYIFDELDGTFPNHEPNPLEEENVKHIKDLVLKTKADIGVILTEMPTGLCLLMKKGIS